MQLMAVRLYCCTVFSFRPAEPRHAIWVKHRDQLEDELPPQQFSTRIIGQQESQKSKESELASQSRKKKPPKYRHGEP